MSERFTHQLMYSDIPGKTSSGGGWLKHNYVSLVSVHIYKQVPFASTRVQIHCLTQWHHVVSLSAFSIIVSGNGLVPDGTKPLPVPKLIHDIQET